jgi:uncharacterized protein (DUF1778 family)
LTQPYDVRTMLGMRTQRLELRLTDEERQIDSAAATAVGETLSDFFRRAARLRAQEVLTDRQQIALSDIEATRFLDALETVDEDAVVRLRDLRRRSTIDGPVDRPA